MYSKLKLSELKNTKLKTKLIFIICFIKLTKVLEVANFRCLTLLHYQESIPHING